MDKASKGIVAAVAAVVALIILILMLFAGSSDDSSDDSGDAGGVAYGGLQSAGIIPAPYMPVLLQAGKTCPEITPAILAAQTYQESTFRDVGSPAGAIGPSQFMPSTWATWGKGGNIHDFHDSIPAQARFDCSLVKDVKAAIASGKVHGDVVTLALDSYNAGFDAILKYGGVPPYPETQGYAPSILKWAAKFATSAAPVNLPSGTLGTILKDALSQVGKPYLLGAGGPGRDSWPRYDCSGLVSWAVWKGTNGKITLPHFAASIRLDPHLQTVEIGKDLSKMKPGDVIVFDLPGEDPGSWGHTALYLGGGKIVEAANTPGVWVNDLVTGWGGYYMRPNFRWDVLRFR